jgi:D-psicose/D-tagatose/L-ribulose 3-epimerase
MKFGVHSILFSESFLEKDLPLLEKFKKMGFDTVEMPPFDQANFPGAKVKKLSEELGLDINIAYGMEPEHNIISPEATVRRSGIDFTKKLVDISNDAGAKIFGGVIYCPWGYMTGKAPSVDEWKWGVEGFREVAEYAASQSDLILCVEPVNRMESHFINTLDAGCRYVEDIDMPNVKLIMDTYHLIREESSVFDSITAAGKHIAYVHANENHRGIPGSGLVAWDEVFRALKAIKFDGCLTLESFDPTNENCAAMGSIWRKLADTPEQLAEEGIAFLKKMAG